MDNPNFRAFWENGKLLLFNAVFLNTNLLDTKDSGEYTALAWAQDGENFLQTTVRGVWKRNGQVFDVKHFENGTDGNQLLTTGTFDFVNNTYKCLVRVLE